MEPTLSALPLYTHSMAGAIIIPLSFLLRPFFPLRLHNYFVIFDRQIIFSSTEYVPCTVFFSSERKVCVMLLPLASLLLSSYWLFHSFFVMLSLQSNLIDLYDIDRIVDVSKALKCTAKGDSTFVVLSWLENERALCVVRSWARFS